MYAVVAILVKKQLYYLRRISFNLVLHIGNVQHTVVNAAGHLHDSGGECTHSTNVFLVHHRRLPYVKFVLHQLHPNQQTLNLCDQEMHGECIAIYTARHYLEKARNFIINEYTTINHIVFSTTLILPVPCCPK